MANFDEEEVDKLLQDLLDSKRPILPSVYGYTRTAAEAAAREHDAVVAAKEFRAVEAGLKAPYLPDRPLRDRNAPRPGTSGVTTEQVIRVITEAIRNAGDDDAIRREASAWLVRISNSIHETLQELDGEE